MPESEKVPVNYQARRAARRQDEPPKPRRWRRIAVTCALCVLSVVAVAVLIYVWYEVTHVKTVSARVRASVVALSPVIDAKLEKVMVKDGDMVEKGAVLALLDSSGLRAALEGSQAEERIQGIRHAEAAARVELVKAQIEGAIGEADADLAVAEARLASAKAALLLRRDRLADQAAQAQARLRESEAVLLALRNGARTEDLAAAKAKVEAANALRDLYQLEVDQSEELVEEGIDSAHILEVRRTRLTTQSIAVREAELALERLEAGARPEEIEAAHQAVEARRAALNLAKAERGELDVLRAAVTVAEAIVAQAEAQCAQARGRRSEITIAKEQAKAAEENLKRARSQVEIRRASLEQTEIVSPVAGRVTRVYDEVGETCRKGVAIMLVAEAGKPRWIEGFVREDDAMRVVAGQRARVQVPAHVGDYVEAEVAQVGLHTQSLDAGGAAAGAIPGQPERVWVRLVPSEPLPGEPITGTSARAVIRVR